MMLDAGSDDECLMRSLPLFDALNARLQAQPVLAAQGGTPLEETRALVAGVAALRAKNAHFAPEALAAAFSRPNAGSWNKDDQR